MEPGGFQKGASVRNCQHSGEVFTDGLRLQTCRLRRPDSNLLRKRKNRGKEAVVGKAVILSDVDKEDPTGKSS